MKPILTATSALFYCFTVVFFTGCKAEQEPEFGHSFASLEEFEEALRSGNVSRFMYAPDNESVRVNRMLKTHWLFTMLDDATQKGVDDWEIRMEELDVYGHAYQTHHVIEEFLIEMPFIPEGTIVVRSPNQDVEYRFFYFEKEGVFFLEGGGLVLNDRVDPNRILGVNLRLLSDHLDYVDIEWRFSVEGVPITRYGRWQVGDSGGWSYQGDEFIELKILTASDSVQIDELSAFHIDDSNDFEKEYRFTIISEEDRLRVVPKTEQ